MLNLAGKKICVTGGTGFLGRHLLPRLLEAGAEATCLVRNPGQASLPSEVRIFEGDLRNGGQLQDFLQGQDILIHLAALLFGSGWNDYLAANSEAAENLAQAWKSLPPGNRPKKAILISSLAACGPCADSSGISEAARPRPVSAYGWSKLMSEQIFESAFGSSLVILRPPIIYGSGDRGLLPLFKSLKAGFGTTPGLFREFPVSVIHADDAANAVGLACGPGASGVYHLSGGKPLSMAAFNYAIAKALGRGKTLLLKMPLWALGLSAGASSLLHLGAARICKIAGRPAPKPPHWNLDKFREAREPGWVADFTRIANELGFAPSVSLEEGLVETVAGYRKDGWL